MICPRCEHESKPAARWPGDDPRYCVLGPFGSPCGGVLVDKASVPKAPRKQTEAGIQRRILTYLNSMGDEVFAWRNSVGFGEVGAELRPGVGGQGYGLTQTPGRMVRFGVVGAPDIIACAWGTFLGIEVKSPTGRQSDNQRKFESRVEAAMGRYVLARSVQDVQFAIDEIRERFAREAGRVTR